MGQALSVSLETTDAELVDMITRLHFGSAVPSCNGRLVVEVLAGQLARDVLETAGSVLEPRTGALLCKLPNWREAVDFVTACRAAAYTICEMVPMVASDVPAYWICAHPSARCRAIGIPIGELV